MDYAETCGTSGSYLYMELLYLKDKDPSTAHDPLKIKKELFRKEKARILDEKLGKDRRLFHFAETSSLDSRDLEFEAKNYEGRQQDAKDFFVSLQESHFEWLDVYSLFKFQPHVYTECRECGIPSVQENAYYKVVSHLDIPPRGSSMADHVANHLNRPTLADGWRCENDPRHDTMGGDNYNKIKDINEVQFLVFVTERLKTTDGIDRWIDYTEVEAGGNVQVVDSKGVSGTLGLIGVIYHVGGRVVDNDTSGHYMADILVPQTQQWFSTSDDQIPRLVNEPSKLGYIYIYKKL